ncbi:MAG: STAS/SEC14 domain-containing protein [Nocardioides sp.]
MITIIEDMPEGTIGFEAGGTVTDEDYETVLVPAVKAAHERGAVRLLYVLPDDTSYSPGAMWADTKLWAGNMRGWERIAIATDADWLENAVKAFGWLMPGEVKLFDDDEVREAKAWLAGSDA